MRHFPVFLSLAGRTCLVVGGGEAAAGRIRLLRKSAAEIVVVAPKLEPAVADLAGATVRVVRRGFVAGDVIGKAAVFAASADLAVDERVAEAAAARGVPANVMDRPHLSTFIVPAIVDRDGIVVAISSGGASPTLARRVREAVESVLPLRLGQLARFLERFRSAVKDLVTDADERRRLWERVLDGPIAAAVLAGNERLARRRMLELLNGPASGGAPAGIVSIVGAGPGDPDLLTVRALRLLRQADVVVYDRLIPAAILDLARRGAERLYVGKSRGEHSMEQSAINALLVRLARAGKQVVRLKGGDPFVFGRGGEELEYLQRHGVAVEAVPGITAATACGAYAGIPLTHRDHAQAVTLLTGQSKDGEAEYDWAALANGRQTLVIYMGVAAAGHIARRLIDHGMAPATPVAIVENGTLPAQKVVGGSVGELAALIRDAHIDGPAIIVIGTVAGFVAQAAAPQALAV